LFRIAGSGLAGIVIITNNVWDTEASGQRMTVIRCTSVIIIAINGFVFARRVSGSVRITRISGTSITIIAVYVFVYTSLILAAIDSGAGIFFFTYIGFIVTA